MSLLLKNYSFVEVIYLLIRFNRTKSSRESQSSVPECVQNKNQLHIFERFMGPDPFLHTLGKFKRCLNEMLQFFCFFLEFCFSGLLRNFRMRGHSVRITFSLFQNNPSLGNSEQPPFFRKFQKFWFPFIKARGGGVPTMVRSCEISNVSTLVGLSLSKSTFHCNGELLHDNQTSVIFFVLPLLNWNVDNL